MIIIEGIAYFTWAIFGMIFWIPLLVRIIAGFCGSVVYNMVVNNPENIQKSKESLDLAVSFYTRGFTNIKSALSGQTQLQSARAKGFNVTADFNLASFIAQIVWTIVFWAGMISPFIDGGIFSLFHRTE